MTVDVTGGSAGITAHIDDLAAMSRLLHAGAVAVADAVAEIGAPALQWELTAIPHDIGGLELAAAVAQTCGPFGPLCQTQAALDSLAGRFLFAARVYRHGDDAVLASILGGVGRLAEGIGLSMIGDSSDAHDHFIAALPGLTDLGAIVTRPLDKPLAAIMSDGHPVLHDLGPDDSIVGATAPRTLDDLMSALAWRNAGAHGEISVSILGSAAGIRRVIVDIPGTKSWDPLPNSDVTSVGTDVRALAGDDTSYEEGIFAALTAAGVTSHDDVMLVGHSEGGIVAVDAARDAAHSGRFRVTHVVIAGAPVGTIARGLPTSVQLLALENSADLVPHCDGASNPDRPNITTVTGSEQHYSVTANHDITASYEPIAEAADDSANRSIRTFTRNAAGFFDATSLETHRFRISRGH